MNLSRRPHLMSIRPQTSTNAGLWLDKYLTTSDKEDNESRRNLVASVAAIDTPPAYVAFYRRWEQALRECGVQTRLARVQGRLVVGLGDESVLETSITLHHTYGVPYVPGSALKGLAASYARQKLEPDDWCMTGEAYKTLFGDTTSAGYVTFYDALYLPGSGHQGRALHADVITVHHRDYYQEGQVAPADWDSPTPIPFLSATGQYLVAMAGPNSDWIHAAFGILGEALAEMGVGAKTSSGYGRMALDGYTTAASQNATATSQPINYDLAKRQLLAEKPATGRLRGVFTKHIKESYGFITQAPGGTEVFLHVSKLRMAGAKLLIGQVVEFSIQKSPTTGKAEAVDVVILLHPQ
jgi:CRISPR-associated protein Cmr6